ncbi:MAG: right-handed parallel beta-helix repeat-containing protein [Acidobacteriota bacterium]|nr:right-handed parallel beta-helix repeat-containing protein [Acidobacteriota bacterium]
MNKIRFSLNVLAFAAFTIALSAMAQAQATRTWVSGVGDDANPCSRTAPCKTYAGAISKTARDGEISTLDPGGFGAVTITKSITINGTTGQGYGSILASSTNGVVINITDAADTRKTVRLNWLDINGAPSSSPGLTGVRILAAAAVYVENTVIDSFRSASAGFGHGIHVNTTAQTELYVRNATIRNCLNDGIRIETTAGTAFASIVNSRIARNGQNGVKFVNGGKGLVANCEIVSNFAVGIDIEETTLQTEVNVEGNYIAFCTTGVQVGAGASEARLSNNFITSNSTGLSNAGGNSFSSGNNRIIGNTTNGAPNQTVVQPV